jgi:CubicO group peptidase (beta-lactamase class C family)
MYKEIMSVITKAGDPPGLSLVVVKNEKIVYSEGFWLADGPRNIPATPDTIYHWWSITKVPTAIATLQLQEREKLDIDDPVRQYLPFFKVNHTTDTECEVTIKHLMNHSSGLPDASLPKPGRVWIHHENESPVNQTELIKSELPNYNTLRFKPGTHGEYTNTGFMVLGAIIEAVTNKTYEDYVIENILRPLKMTYTNFVYTKDMIPFAAAGSHSDPDGSWEQSLRKVIPDFDSYVREKVEGRFWFHRYYTDQSSTSGLIGPATDAARLAMMYLNKGELDGERILSLESISKMTYEGHVRVKDPSSERYADTWRGLGWASIAREDGRLWVEHIGGGVGFGSSMRLYPEEGLGIIMMANDTKIHRDTIIDHFASLDW